MEEWTSQNGEKKSAPVIIVNQLDFGGSGNQAGSQRAQQPTQQPQQSQQQQQTAPQNIEPPLDFDDDIPF